MSLYDVHLFPASPNSRQRPTVLNSALCNNLEHLRSTR